MKFPEEPESKTIFMLDVEDGLGRFEGDDHLRLSTITAFVECNIGVHKLF